MRAEINAQSKHRVVSPSRIVCVSFAAIRFLISDGRESFKQGEIQQLFNSLLKRKSFGNYSANSFSGKIGTKQKCELELGVRGGVHPLLAVDRALLYCSSRSAEVSHHQIPDNKI